MKVSFVRTLGVLAIAHALSHVLLPMRGAFEPAYLISDYTPILLFVASTSGFLIAGIGLLGWRVLNIFISPLLVLSSGLSSVAILHLGDGDLIGGIVLNAAFFFLGLWRAFPGWPEKDAVEVDHLEHLWTSR